MVGRPGAWNTAVDATTAKNLIHAVDVLHSQSPAISVARSKVHNLRDLLFEDEYASLMCDIDAVESELKSFLQHIYDNGQFTEMISGQVRTMGTILDVAEAIREFDKRITEFRLVFDKRIADLTSPAAAQVRKARCKAARPSCTPPPGSPPNALFPCAISKPKGVLKRSKCRYKYLE